MKKTFVFLFAIVTFSLSAQNFNKWSLDVGGGFHDIPFGLSPGSDINHPDLWQANIGIRKMFNENFGVRLGFGMNKIKGKSTNPFEANFSRVSLEGVANAGNYLNFQNWTKRFNLLLHAGVGFGQLDNVTPLNANNDSSFHLIFGFTPQYRISNRLSLFLDYSILTNYNQSRTFNGATVAGFKDTQATILNTSIGVNFAIGKYKRHADFWRKEEDSKLANEVEVIKQRLDSVENEVAELKNRKPEIVATETLVKELDKRYVKKEDMTLKNGEIITASNVNFIKELLSRGYVNVYFDVNKTEVQKGSIGAINYLKQFMLDNPSVTAVLVGYADESGDDQRNQRLSERRAKKVFEILVAAGINSGRLTYSGGGVDRSVGKEARQLARKVRFLIN